MEWKGGEGREKGRERKKARPAHFSDASAAYAFLIASPRLHSTQRGKNEIRGALYKRVSIVTNYIENVVIANALQFQAAPLFFPLIRRHAKFEVAKPIHCRIIAFFCCWNITLRCERDLWPLALNICCVSPVTWWNAVPNLNAIDLSAVELVRF